MRSNLKNAPRDPTFVNIYICYPRSTYAILFIPQKSSEVIGGHKMSKGGNFDPKIDKKSTEVTGGQTEVKFGKMNHTTQFFENLLI